MNTENNLKYRTTDRMIKESLLGMMEKGRNVSEITVSDICRKAGINRSTFYDHYSVPGDVLDSVTSEVLKNTENALGRMGGPEENALKYTVSLLTYIKENERIFRILFLDSGDSAFSEAFTRQTFRIFDRIRTRYKDKDGFAYVQAYTYAGSKEIIRVWIKDGCRSDVREIAEMIIDFDERAIDAAFAMTEKKK